MASRLSLAVNCFGASANLGWTAFETGAITLTGILNLITMVYSKLIIR